MKDRQISEYQPEVDLSLQIFKKNKNAIDIGANVMGQRYMQDF